MNVMKRAFLSMTRNPGKSILLLAILVIIGNMIAGAISMKQASSHVEKSIKTSMGTAATLEIDWPYYQERLEQSEGQALEVKNLSAELIKQVGASKYVKYYDFTASTGGNSPTLEKWLPEHHMGSGGSTDNQDFNFNGVHLHQVMAIQEGKLRLMPGGRVFTEEEIKNAKQVAIISKELAEKNNIKVGDTVVFTYTSEYFDRETKDVLNTYSHDRSFEIIGITERLASTQNQRDKKLRRQDEWEAIERANRIIVPVEVVLQIKKTNLQKMLEESDFEPEIIQTIMDHSDHYRPLYMLKDPEDIEAFRSETQPLLPEFYVVKTATEEYHKISGPVEQISKMANGVLLIALVAAIFIVNLVVLLFLRDRKHELGIYLSLGESKSKVLTQILLEVLVISVIALGISLFSGNWLAEAISDSMIQSQLDSTKQSESDQSFSYGNEDYFNSDLTMEDVVERYRIDFNPSYVIFYSLVSLLTMVASTVLPMSYILRINPKKIMM